MIYIIWIILCSADFTNLKKTRDHFKANIVCSLLDKVVTLLQQWLIYAVIQLRWK